MSDRRVVPARSDGEKLYLQLEPDGPEVPQDWSGPPGAHHATIDQSEHVHVYTTKITRTVSVYDAAGVLLGVLENSHWD